MLQQLNADITNYRIAFVLFASASAYVVVIVCLNAFGKPQITKLGSENPDLYNRRQRNINTASASSLLMFYERPKRFCSNN